MKKEAPDGASFFHLNQRHALAKHAYGGARRVLEQVGIKLKGLNVDKLRAEYQALETQKKELTTTYKSCEKEVWNLKRKQENLNRYLGRTQTDPVQEQQTKNKNHSL